MRMDCDFPNSAPIQKPINTQADIHLLAATLRSMFGPKVRVTLSFDGCNDKSEVFNVELQSGFTYLLDPESPRVKVFCRGHDTKKRLDSCQDAHALCEKIKAFEEAYRLCEGQKFENFCKDLIQKSTQEELSSRGTSFFMNEKWSIEKGLVLRSRNCECIFEANSGPGRKRTVCETCGDEFKRANLYRKDS